MKNKMMELIRLCCSWVLGLSILIDFVIKIVIDIWFMDVRLLFFEWLGFKPFLNKEQLSILNNELNMSVSLPILLVINSVCVLLIFYMIHEYKKAFVWNKFADVGFKILLAGVICSFIDKAVWGGSLDYILLYKWIIDLKDIYLVMGFGLIILSVVLFKNNRNKIKEK